MWKKKWEQQRNDNLSDRKSFRWPLRNVTYSEDQDQTCFNQGQIHGKYHSNIESPFRAPHHHAQFATFMIFFYFMERGCSVEMIWPFPLIKGLVELNLRGNITLRLIIFSQFNWGQVLFLVSPCAVVVI